MQRMHTNWPPFPSVYRQPGTPGQGKFEEERQDDSGALDDETALRPVPLIDGPQTDFDGRHWAWQ